MAWLLQEETGIPMDKWTMKLNETYNSLKR